MNDFIFIFPICTRVCKTITTVYTFTEVTGIAFFLTVQLEENSYDASHRRVHYFDGASKKMRAIFALYPTRPRSPLGLYI